MHRWLLPVLLAALVAGCVHDTPTTSPDLEGQRTAEPRPENPARPAASILPGLAVERIATGLTCRSLCEPVVQVAGDTIFVKGDTYARSTGDGFSAFQPPAMPSPVPWSFHTDRHLDIGPDGALWFSALVAHYDQLSGIYFTITGLHIARSDDGGDTWPVSNYLALPSETPSDAWGADRQWLGFGPDGRVHVSFQRNYVAIAAGDAWLDRGGVWLASSEDQGRSWSDFENIDPEPGSVHITGQMVFDGNEPLVPIQDYNGEPQLALFGPTSSPLRLDEPGSFFPSVLPHGDGYLVAHRDATDTLDLFAWDGQAVQVMRSTEGAMVSSPWLREHATGWDVVWLERTNGTDDQFDILWSRDAGPPMTVASGLQGNWGVRVNTDFAHFAYLDGWPLIVAGDNDDASLSLYWVHPV